MKSKNNIKNIKNIIVSSSIASNLKVSKLKMLLKHVLVNTKIHIFYLGHAYTTKFVVRGIINVGVIILLQVLISGYSSSHAVYASEKEGTAQIEDDSKHSTTWSPLLLYLFFTTVLIIGAYFYNSSIHGIGVDTPDVLSDNQGLNPAIPPLIQPQGLPMINTTVTPSTPSTPSTLSTPLEVSTLGSPDQSTATALAPLTQPLLPSSVDIINDFNRIASSTVGSQLELAKECENWIKINCPVSCWPTRERMYQDFNGSPIGSLTSEMKIHLNDETRNDFHIQLFRIAVASQTVILQRSLTLDPNAFCAVFLNSLSKMYNLTELGYT